ncbi:thermonuclease family protein [Lysinibacillus endophyticus]|uniref:Micrococcal nuclease n=1 Tax=Ureibacillus endophyticus TaxID=1978490 RepID=A0A494Z574_9BACL|nr:thermonuclease family protein [Lysinibacillus endophyticus]MCP1143839.1 thermonuclease family protein [Lysinibacillus endophyticus]RKQ17667.1 micrococcal nuclease [Lysinibacillus endophyticus]
MKASDIKTIITSGTVILAVVLYLLFNNSSKESEQISDEYKITPELAVEATGNELIEAQYISINDGDTFRVKVNGQEERIRLLMIDTPEMNYDKKDPMPYAEEAKSYTLNLLENASKIELLYDVGPETDNYGRLLTYVFVDDVLLQELLLKEGYAAVRYINEPNNTLEKEFREIEETAKANKLNIWEHENYLQKDGFHPEVIQN